MEDGKSNYIVDSEVLRTRNASRTTNILDLLEKNKAEERKEKIAKFYTLLAFLGLSIMIIGTAIYL